MPHAADVRYGWTRSFILIFSLYTTLHDAHGAHLHHRAVVFGPLMPRCAYRPACVPDGAVVRCSCSQEQETRRSGARNEGGSATAGGHAPCGQLSIVSAQLLVAHDPPRHLGGPSECFLEKIAGYSSVCFATIELLSHGRVGSVAI